MTRTQRKALADLRRLDVLYPAGHGISGSPTYSWKTLQALVDEQVAVWVYPSDGVIPHIKRASYIRGGLS